MSTTIERILHELESRDRGPSTPLYIVSEEILKDNIDAMNRAFFSRFDRFILGYSYKTNYAKDVLRMVHQEGGYAEVVSPMELDHFAHLTVIILMVIFIYMTMYQANTSTKPL